MSSEVEVERPTSLSLDGARPERRVHFSDTPIATATTTQNIPRISSPPPKKYKFDPDFKPKRKRAWSCSILGGERFNNKKRKCVVPPTKFLLGGNSGDPLNLAALDGSEDIKQVKRRDSNNLVSGGSNNHRSSVVQVIIPPNINDPLNLDANSDNELSHADAILRQRKRRRTRKRRRRNSEPGGVSCSNDMPDVPSLLQQGKSSSDPNCNIQTESDVKENTDIPLPVPPSDISDATKEIRTLQRSISAPSTSIKNYKPLAISTDEEPIEISTATTTITTTTTTTASAINIQTNTPTTSKSSSSSALNQKNNNSVPLKRQRKSLEDKIVSPVIPQPGSDKKRHPSHPRRPPDKPHLSQQNILPPKSFKPKDEYFQYGNYCQYYGYRNPDNHLDSRLQYFKSDWFNNKEVLDIGCNIGHITLTVARDFNPKRVVGIDIDKKLVSIAQKNIKHYMQQGRSDEAHFPKSMRLLYGPLKPPINDDGSRTFPYNVKFVHSNYVLENKELLETVKPEFDVILCLSVTKWIHLNWGDDGLVRFFKRAYNNLHPGGKFILEPQSWHSYNKKRKLTKDIFENYKMIRLFPDKFQQFLVKEVGFISCKRLSTPHHFSPGFQRPIYIFTKSDKTQSDNTESKATNLPMQESKSEVMECDDNMVQNLLVKQTQINIVKDSTIKDGDSIGVPETRDNSTKIENFEEISDISESINISNKSKTVDNLVKIEKSITNIECTNKVINMKIRNNEADSTGDLIKVESCDENIKNTENLVITEKCTESANETTDNPLIISTKDVKLEDTEQNTDSTNTQIKNQ